MKTLTDLFYSAYSPRQKRYHLSMTLREKDGEHINQNITERPGGHQSHRRRERTGISDGSKRLSKKISGERKVIKTEKADFKLKEVISRIGMRIWVY